MRKTIDRLVDLWADLFVLKTITSGINLVISLLLNATE